MSIGEAVGGTVGRTGLRSAKAGRQKGWEAASRSGGTRRSALPGAPVGGPEAAYRVARQDETAGTSLNLRNNRAQDRLRVVSARTSLATALQWLRDQVGNCKQRITVPVLGSTRVHSEDEA